MSFIPVRIRFIPRSLTKGYFFVKYFVEDNKKDRGKSMIVVKDVRKQFKDKQVLKGISFHIAPFECVGIIGKNGAGKTTLLNMISGILKADSGFIRINACKDILSDVQVLKNVLCVRNKDTVME